MGSKEAVLPLLAFLLFSLCFLLPLLFNLPTFWQYMRKDEAPYTALQPGTKQREAIPKHVPYNAQDEEYGGPIAATEEDLKWVQAQLYHNHLGDPPKSAAEWHQLRKGINPRTRAQQLEDLHKFKGISHYEGIDNHTALPCPGELLVEEHHSNYGEPWAGGRDVFEFLARKVNLKPQQFVLEIGCGTLRVGLHFIRYLLPSHFHCVEKDPLSLMAAFRYELPSQGLLHKRPVIVREEELNFDALGKGMSYDIIYASAVFLHMPDALVWTGLERLAPLLAPINGRLFVSHNIKFCTRLPAGVCNERLTRLNMEFVGKQTHDSLLFNHYEIWFEFKSTVSS